MTLLSPVYAQAINITPGGQFAGLNDITIANIISALIVLVLVIAALIFFFMLVWGGIRYITSGGDKTKTEQARNRITNALVGLAIVAASYAVMRLISYFFGVNVLDAGTTIPRPF